MSEQPTRLTPNIKPELNKQPITFSLVFDGKRMDILFTDKPISIGTEVFGIKTPLGFLRRVGDNLIFIQTNPDISSRILSAATNLDRELSYNVPALIQPNQTVEFYNKPQLRTLSSSLFLTLANPKSEEDKTEIMERPTQMQRLSRKEFSYEGHMTIIAVDLENFTGWTRDTGDETMSRVIVKLRKGIAHRLSKIGANVRDLAFRGDNFIGAIFTENSTEEAMKIATELNIFIAFLERYYEVTIPGTHVTFHSGIDKILEPGDENLKDESNWERTRSQHVSRMPIIAETLEIQKHSSRSEIIITAEEYKELSPRSKSKFEQISIDNEIFYTKALDPFDSKTKLGEPILNWLSEYWAVDWNSRSDTSKDTDK